VEILFATILSSLRYFTNLPTYKPASLLPTSLCLCFKHRLQNLPPSSSFRVLALISLTVYLLVSPFHSLFVSPVSSSQLRQEVRDLWLGFGYLMSSPAGFLLLTYKLIAHRSFLISLRLFVTQSISLPVTQSISYSISSSLIFFSFPHLLGRFFNYFFFGFLNSFCPYKFKST